MPQAPNTNTPRQNESNQHFGKQRSEAIRDETDFSEAYECGKVGELVRMDSLCNLFLDYRSIDQARVRSAAEALRRAGVDAWLDERRISSETAGS